MDHWPGLTDPEAAKRLSAEGPNELSREREFRFLSLAMEILRDPIFLLLFSSGIVYFILGDIKESFMLTGFVIFILVISMIQETRTGRALDALKNLSSPRALVIRDGRRKRVPGREVVRGDIIEISEGDRVPADAGILWNSNLLTDESLLTGESTPVCKSDWDAKTMPVEPGGENLPFVYSGTLVVRGKAVAEVIVTGDQTAMGKIGKSLREVQTEQTPLQQETRSLVRSLAFIAMMISAFVVLGYGLIQKRWLDGILAGIALAMAILPNEFPVILTIFLALGAWRISKKNVLTRRIPAVETLGSATVLCVDKTGTLTYNRMALAKIYTGGQFQDLRDRAPSSLPDSIYRMIEFGILASVPETHDPMEKALKSFGDAVLLGSGQIHTNWRLAREYPLTKDLLVLANAWDTGDLKNGYKIAAKGAPEAIAHLCKLGGKGLLAAEMAASRLAGEGFRVIGVAESQFIEPDLPKTQEGLDYRFLGWLAFEEPIRKGVPEAIQTCRRAGIRVIMMTGDYLKTAQTIARRIELPSDVCLTGREIDSMNDRELAERVRSAHVFARVVPEQKLRLVNALKANGEVVAMTGDGVNDAPALKAAHIGIAMGERGTDVARESASLVLLDDDFTSIVESMHLGRRIFDNLNKALAYLIAIHVPIACISLAPAILGWPLVLMPIHIAFLHLVIDPACSIVFEEEPEDPDLMSRPPRSPKEPLFGKSAIILSLLQGLGVFAVIAAIFSVAIYRGQGESDARALTFTTLMIANLSLILTNRSWSRTIASSLETKNRVLWLVVLGGILFLALVLYVPFLRGLFKFSFLHAGDLLLCFSAGPAGILWFELLKLFRNRRGIWDREKECGPISRR